MASRVVLYIAVSKNGKIASKNGSFEFLDKYNNPVEDFGYSIFTQRIKHIIMGTNSFKQVSTFKEWPYKNHHSHIITNQSFSLNPIDYPNLSYYSLINENNNNENNNNRKIGSLKELIIELKKDEYKKDIWLMGGAKLIDSFLQEDLIDEFIITKVGNEVEDEGIPLFIRPFSFEKFHLTKTISFPSFNDVLQEHYERL